MKWKLLYYDRVYRVKVILGLYWGYLGDIWEFPKIKGSL